MWFNKMNNRVVVTGIGIVSSIGIGVKSFWGQLVSGKCGISPVTAFDVSGYDNKVGGEVKNFKAEEFIPKERLKNIARASQFAISATKLALEDAGRDILCIYKDWIAVMMGTTMGEGGMIEEIDKHWTGLGEEDVWGLTVSKYPSNAIANNISRFFNINGINFMIPTACAAGNYSIGFGYDMISTGRVKCAIAGGADPFSRIGYTGFGRLYAMAPEKCQPFDKNRKGMIVGEGSGVLILEELESAKKRKAKIYAEILGYGLSCDANHMTAPRVEGIVKVMEKAIKNSGVKKEDVDYICAHGTGTPANDKTECEAIKRVFGGLAKKIKVNSLKSMLGHTMGAASAIEAAACCLSISEGMIAPTINYETPDPECDLDCVPNKAVKQKCKIVLNNSLAFGGNNACLVIGSI